MDWITLIFAFASSDTAKTVTFDQIIGDWFCRIIKIKTANFADTPTFTLDIYDSNYDKLYSKASIAENTVTIDDSKIVPITRGGKAVLTATAAPGSDQTCYVTLFIVQGKHSVDREKFLLLLDQEWTPLNLGGFIALFRSTENIIKDGADRVSEWGDKTGQGNHISQATDSKKLVWTPNQLNGYPALIGDGTDDWMQRAAFTGGAIAQPNTTYAIIIGQQDGNEYRVSLDGISDGFTNGAFIGGLADPVGTWSMYAGLLERRHPTWVLDEVNYQLVIQLFNDASSWMWFNNEAKWQPPASPGADPMNGINLFRWRNAESFIWKGGIVEFGIRHGGISDAEVEQIKNYARYRYGFGW